MHPARKCVRKIEHQTHRDRTAYHQRHGDQHYSIFNDLWNRLLHPNWQWKVSMLLIIEQYEYFQLDSHVFFYKHCAEWNMSRNVPRMSIPLLASGFAGSFEAFPFSCHALLIRYTGLCLLLYDMSNDKMIKWNVPKSSDASKWHLVCKFDVVEQNFLLISCL